MYSRVPEQKLKFGLSPVMMRKARKNAEEVAGMIQANVRDAVALIDLMARLDEGMAAGEEWDELKVSNFYLTPYCFSQYVAPFPKKN